MQNRTLVISLAVVVGILLGFEIARSLPGGVLSAVVAEASAQEGPRSKKCVWSYISDKASPELGEAGIVKMSDEWTAMSRGGWRLVATNENMHYIFEHCD